MHKLQKQTLDVGLHATGVIYKNRLLECFRLGLLNPHLGILPRYRGRSVMEWSIFYGDATGITTFFIDEGIDTGERIVLRQEVSVKAYKDITEAKNYLFALDAKMFAEALQKLQQPTYQPILQKPEDGIRFYVMSDLFRSVVTQMMKEEL
ncbi:MAG: formyltransferase family protein [Anaerolineae bacterium]